MTRRAPHAKQVGLDQFARRLHAAMSEKGFNNSELARRVWGETKDAKGYNVAKNRDRIGVYLKGKGFPEPDTLAKLAECLDTTPDKLAPEMTVAAVDGERPEFAMTMVGEQMHVQINAVLPLSVANEIAELVIKAKKRDRVEGEASLSSDGPSSEDIS